MKDKISVITVVYNDAANIRNTIESYFSQTWEEKEYIVIDGGSTDGTKDIIAEYADRIAFWCSEKDGGIYDAMNKGISHATGTWINILNSGDNFAFNTSLEDTITAVDPNQADVIYTNCISRSGVVETKIIAPDDTSLLRKYPIYRHGASLTRTSVQKQFLFDLSRKKDLEYSLDWNMIFSIYTAGYRFRKANTCLQVYDAEGASAHRFKSYWYNYKITSNGKFSLPAFLFFLRTSCINPILDNKFTADVKKWIRAFLFEFIVNEILPMIPFWAIRKTILKLCRMKIGKNSFINLKSYFMAPSRLKIGDYTHINRGCTLDARGFITIGNNVSISHGVSIFTGSHDKDSHTFREIDHPIIIEDYVWIGANATILQNITIGKGAIVCAGSVVNRDVEPYTIVGGVPAQKKGQRSSNLDYHCIWDCPFT